MAASPRRRSSAAAAPCSGAPPCQLKQPASVILWHLCQHMHTRAGTQRRRRRRQGAAELMTHLSAPPPPSSPPSLSLFLRPSPSVQETSLRRATRRKEASCWRRSSRRSKVRHRGACRTFSACDRLRRSGRLLAEDSTNCPGESKKKKGPEGWIFYFFF